MDLIYQIFTQ